MKLGETTKKEKRRERERESKKKKGKLFRIDGGG
jgi:hypothetical protein